MLEASANRQRVSGLLARMDERARGFALLVSEKRDVFASEAAARLALEAEALRAGKLAGDSSTADTLVLGCIASLRQARASAVAGQEGRHELAALFDVGFRELSLWAERRVGL